MKKSLSLVFATLSSGVFAATYYWKGVNDYLSWSDPSNWSVTGVDGEAASTVPTNEDRLYGLQATRYFDLDGATDLAIDGMTSDGNWDRHYIQVKNGTLTILGSYASHSDDWTLNEGARLVLAESSTYTASNNHGAPDRYFVKNGGALEIRGAYRDYKTEITVEEGGACTLAPKSFGLHNGTGQTSTFLNSGALSFPNGLVWSTGSASGGVNVRQTAGTLTLGGRLDKNGQAGRFTLALDGGTVVVTDDVTFDMDAVTVGSEPVAFDVAEGKTIDMDAVAYADGASVTKSGPGTMKFGASLPSYLYLAGGSLEVTSDNQTLSGHVTGAGCGIKIAARGFAMAAEVDTEVSYAIDSSLFAIGDTILTCADAGQLAKAQADLAAVGVATSIDGTALKRAASEIVFNSTTVTDLNEPSGWKSGSLPGEGVEVMIAGEGVTAIVSSAIPAFGGIVVQNGATLKLDLEGVALPSVKLANGAKLVLSKSATLAGLTNESGAEAMNDVTVAKGATLKVPGNTVFTDMKLTVNGTIEGTTDGKLVFGYARAGETSKFTMTADGATITALNAAKKENAARLDFVCPEPGGTVVVTEPILLKNTTLTYDKKDAKEELDGMAFGLNNPVDQAFTITAENTDLYVGAETTIAGAANLVLNGSRLIRWRHAEGDTAQSLYNIVVQNKGKIIVDAGGSIYAGVTRVNKNETDGAIRLQPDEEGFFGIEFRDGSTAHWYKANGYNKGAIAFGNSVFEMTKSFWWSWGNRSHVFNKMLAVEIAAEKRLTFKCVKETIYSSNNDTYTYFILESPFTGAGDIFFTSDRASQQFQPTVVCNNNTCTGTLSVEDGKNVMVHFANGANWAGKVVLNGKVDLVPADDDHKVAANAGPTVVSFGGAELAETFAFRVWATESEGAVTVVSDRINVGAQGWSGEGTVVFDPKSALTLGDVPSGTEFVLGTMPKGGTVPACGNDKVELFAREIEGDETTSELVARVKDLEFVFTGGSEGVTDLNNAQGWSCGSVPTDNDVIVRGEGVTALLNAEQGLPRFTSIALRNGAALQIVGKNASDEDFVLPSLSFDAFSTIVIGDDAETPTTVRLPDTFATGFALDGEDGVALTRLVVKKGATLVVPAGMKFKNVDIAFDGIVTKGTNDGEGVTFGYASEGETSYIAFRSVQGKFDIQSSQNQENGKVAFVCPAAGGRVKVVGDITIKEGWFPVRDWADFGYRYFGVNNPVDEPFTVVLDATKIECPWSFKAGGAAHLVLKNGSSIVKAWSCRNHGFNSTLADKAQIEVVGGECFFDHAGLYNDFLFSASEATDGVLLREGGIYLPFYTKGNGTVSLVSSNGVVGVNRLAEKRQVTDGLFNGLKAVRVEEDTTLTFMSVEKGDVGKWASDDWNRDIKIAKTVPMTGAGDVTLVNGLDDASLAVTVQNGENTCTGRIGVTLPDAESGRAVPALRFADGANWAGTVVADGNVSLAGEKAVTVSFGGVEFAGNLSVRLFVAADGTVTTDKINITGAGYSVRSGVAKPGLEIVAPEDFEAPSRAVYTLGTIAPGAALPKLKGRYWKVVTETVDGVTTYGIKRNLGFCINFR